MRDHVARVRQLLSEASRAPTRPAEATEAATKRAFDLYEFNSEAPFLLEQSARARSEREIARIAAWYRWEGEIARHLDAFRASSVAALDEKSLDALLNRMQKLEQCVQDGHDPPDAAPAR